ncbi:MAG: choice-of-anchor L domain-containing protein [Bacteroidetes bacterium]|nr:choice-of-anchor L domain-containing protein [Bacteroidota bacterium]
MRLRIKFLSIPLLLALLSIDMTAQLQVQSSQTVQWYVENVLLGAGVSASNITFNGQPANQVNLQCGFFQSNGSYMDLESGLVLSTGNVIGVDFFGDSVFVGTSTTISVNNGQGGDNDLETLSNENINDQAILEFDFIPTGDTLRFNYVFGSEEYPEYVNSFNDAFGFFLAGPGISGPFSAPAGFPNGSKNIALIPGTNTPVTIDNVNNGNGDCFFGGPSGPCTNCEFYVDNCDIEDVALDGMTTVLEAFALVQCGQTYHIKLAIGDALDSSFDSAVFLQEGSFQSSLAISSGLFSSIGPDLDGILYENCGYGVLTFSRSNGIEDEALVELTVTGVGQNGIDFSTIPSSFIFPAGDSTFTITVSAIIDNLPEGIEEVFLSISNTSVSACSGSITSEFTFYISDDPSPLTISTEDYDIDCGDVINISALVEGGYGQYQYNWSNGGTTNPMEVSPGFTTDYILIVTDTCNAGSIQDTVTVTVPVYPPMTVEIPESAELICLEETDFSPITVSGGDGNYTYLWTQNGQELGNTFTLSYIATNTSVLTFIAEDGCGSTAVDELIVNVPEEPIILQISPDTTICLGDMANLVINATGGEPPFIYEWSYFNAPQTEILVGPREDTYYSVQVTDLCENIESANVLVKVASVDASFLAEMTDYYGVILNNNSTSRQSDTLIYVWDFGDGNTSFEDSPSHTYFELTDQTITLIVTNEIGCRDSTGLMVEAPPILFVPTSFSPNSDGINDLFQVVGDGVLDFEMYIFDRWGQKVFYTDDMEEPWNGRARQNSEYYGENDTFAYHIRARLTDGQRLDLHGVVTLLR